VPHAEEPAVPFEERGKLGTAADGGARGRRPRGGIESQFAQVTEVDQQGVIAQRPVRPAVTAGANSDAPTAVSREANAIDDVGPGTGPKDCGRIPAGHPMVKAAADSGVFVAGVTPHE
jgi:hypothetical protein